jgi:TonB family protein
MCVLQREFGAANRPLTLGIRPDLMTPRVMLVLIQPGSGGHRFEVPAVVSFGSGGSPVETQLDSLKMPKRDLRVNEASIERAELDRALPSERIDVQAQQLLDVRLKVPGLGRALTILDECVADLLEGWGFSRLEQAKLASFPKPRGGRVDVTSDHYPSAALDKDESGSTVARVGIAADGTPSECKILVSSRSKPLDDASCKGLLRSKYEPALGKDGAAVPSFFVTQVNWRILN